jgi:hypothetical protein
LGALDEVDEGGVAVGVVALGDVVDSGEAVDFGDVVAVGDVLLVRAPGDVGSALLVVVDGVDAFAVGVDVLIDVAVTDGDADPPAGAFPQPARTSPAEARAGSSTLRAVHEPPDGSLPISTR